MARGTSSASAARAVRRWRTSSNARRLSRHRPTRRRTSEKRLPPPADAERRTFGPLMDRRELGAGTRVVRAARSLPPGDGRPVVLPLVQSVAFAYDSASEQDAVFGNERAGYVYWRYGTPPTAALAGRHGAALAIGATFAAPVLRRPAKLGAAIVIQSHTKYLNGHGDVMGGAVSGSKDLARAMRERTILDGGYLPPHEAWLVIRGMRTLALRVERQCVTALEVARHLSGHPKIGAVRYPGLPDQDRKSVV